MVGCVVGETHYLVFQAWAISGAGAANVAIIHRRVFNVITNNVMCFGPRMRDIAQRVKIIVCVTTVEPVMRIVRGLGFTDGKINAVPIYACGCPGFKAHYVKSCVPQNR